MSEKPLKVKEKSESRDTKRLNKGEKRVFAKTEGGGW